MANFSEKELSSSAINNGVRYTDDDGLQPDAVNAIVEGIMFLNAQNKQSLPSVTPLDKGAFLRVDSSGNWVAEQIPFAEGVEF